MTLKLGWLDLVPESDSAGGYMTSTQLAVRTNSNELFASYILADDGLHEGAEALSMRRLTSSFKELGDLHSWLDCYGGNALAQATQIGHGPLTYARACIEIQNNPNCGYQEAIQRAVFLSRRIRDGYIALVRHSGLEIV